MSGEEGIVNPRPYTATDNCYSESHFKTLRYRPDFPDRFGSMQDARAYTYIEHFNGHRPHRALEMQPQLRVIIRRRTMTAQGECFRRDVLGGLIHEYERERAA
jgi:hypothetical protein